MSDIISIPRPAPRQIPRYVSNLNAIAETAGMTISVYVDANDDGEQRLFSRWCGRHEQLWSTNLFARFQQNAISGSHIRSSPQRLASPGKWWDWFCVVAGTLTRIDANLVEYEIDNGAAEYRIERRDGIEIVHEPDMTAYHGSLAALVAAGIDRKRLPTGVRGGRWGCTSDPAYAARRHPDGWIVYRLETQSHRDKVLEDFDRRLEELNNPLAQTVLGSPAYTREIPKAKPRPSFLRLVVDNTKGSSAQV